MKDIAFHITDIAENSIHAQATVITITIIHGSDHTLYLRFEDNGCGMTAETLAQADNPFYTTRTTRHIGLGLSFLRQSCEQTKGHLHIHSIRDKGTVVEALFHMNNIDAPPTGNIGLSLAQLMSGNPDINFIFKLHSPELNYELTTQEIKHILEEIPISKPEVTIYLEQELNNALKPIVKECALFL